ncbi:unnamed protein product [Prunus brigantina]
MKTYLHSIKEIADGLAAAGQSLSESDIVAYVLGGLPEEYDPLVTSIETRLEPVTSDELHGLLLSREAVILKRQARKSSQAPFHAYAATAGNDRSFKPWQSRGRGRGRHQFSSGSPSTNTFVARPYNSGQGILPTPNHSSSGSFFPNSSVDRPLVCQICDKKGHSALTCRQRLNLSYNATQIPAQFAGPTAHFAQPFTPPSSTASPSGTVWLADSGASSHVTSNLGHLSNHSPYQGSESLRIGDGKSLQIHHVGSATMHTPHASFNLQNVLHVPNVAHNLLSVFQFVRDNHCSLTLDEYGFSIKDNISQRMLCQGPVENGLYPIYCSSSVKAPSTLPSAAPTAYLVCKASLSTWHKRLGHPHQSMLKSIVNRNNLQVTSLATASMPCSACVLGKATRLPFMSQGSVSSKPLELIFSDVWGPSPVESSSGYKYYVLFVDDFTKYSWLYPLHAKSDVCSTFEIFKSKVENVLNARIMTLRSDSGGEYLSKQFQEFLNTHGIVHQLSCPHTPQQNGIAERKHRHIVETARTFLCDSGLPHQYWIDAFQTAVYLINRLPISATVLSPWEQLFRKSPNYQSLKVFGCACYPWLQPYASSKLHPKSRLCVFISYSLHHSGYRCLDPGSGRVFISRHVVFHEDHFPFLTMPTSSSSGPSSSLSPFPQIPLCFPAACGSASFPSSSSSSDSSSSSHGPSPLAPTSHPPALSSPPIPPISHPPAPSCANMHPMVTRSKAGISKPKALLATKHPVSSVVNHLSTLPPTPTTYKQAAKSQAWQEAMQSELNALLQTNTWTLVPPSPLYNLVGCKWVYRVKFKPDGSVDRFKARLVAKGFHQQEGLDYHETFSPVAKPVTIRLLFSLAIQYGWFLHQLDVSNAFLHGYLHDDVYMEQPPGFSDPLKPHFVCKLNRSLYGLKQAPRAWYDELFQALIGLGFQSSQADTSLFIKAGPDLVFILVYVDDILVTGSSPSACQQVIQHLSSQFPVKDLGSLHYFLGLQVTRSDRGLFLNQTKYAYDLLHKTDFLGAKACTTPLGSFRLDNSSPLLADPTFYRSTVGALQYLTWTRPDLAFAVNQVCQFMHQPRESHLGAVKRILRYLKGTLEHGLWFQQGSTHLSAYSDADWAGCPIDRGPLVATVCSLAPISSLGLLRSNPLLLVVLLK